MEAGLRERKKRRTRQALVEAAVRLFEEKGYDGVTVAEIAAAAEVSTRTFFLHFQTKDDVLFANAAPRIDLGLQVIAERAGEPMREVLGRAMEAMIGHVWDGDLTSGLAALRVRLAAGAPALQAGMLQRFFTAQTELSGALCRAYPDELDEVGAAALVGALIGAVVAATATSIGRGDSPDQVRDAMRRAAELVLPPGG
ncbi:hypothetical protein Misp01_77240 [Microtetraspora sp. NBRC 13810]|uniref:TetR/AcrR family transcriptional regulator n=1 Tax=Microtetraspora sp. NBRC 13810 TaxID=3030990 RepID=UPI0024A5258C|nr:TetR/AcrR family transcriptional regulator [Microtetraspora sp. NBRC 13810]GLW12596.1 hypothetical protein Misp01_77240 [Microtetraspora sp. NBRC 13810]